MKQGYFTNSFWLAGVVIFCLVAGLYGCAAKDTSRALVVPLFGASDAEPDTATIEKIKQGDFGPDGMIFKAIVGDVIDVNFSVNGDVASGKTAEPIPVTLKRGLWVYVVDDTVLVSLDGKNYQTPDKVFTGRLSAEFSLEKDIRKNQVDIDLIGNLKNQ